MDAGWEEQAVSEAVSSLGLIRPEATATILSLLRQVGLLAPKAVTTAFRKSGAQLTADEKRALGMRANAFMSAEAMGDLTPEGCTRPLDAHNETVARAFFTVCRAKDIERAAAHPYGNCRFKSSYCDCRGCQRLEGQIASSPFPPADCDHGWCSLYTSVRIDYIQEFADKFAIEIARRADLVLAGDSNEFGFNCLNCGLRLRLDPNNSPPSDAIVSCSGCERAFGAFSALHDAACSELRKRSFGSEP